ncbi:hypothetical protein [Thiobacter aerophilum]|uniref:Uncharacterized protein n=1 Tax=Thiobacter aerophilum TaxID=3121275 RepID=A0ABV0EDU8_9BURK
MLSKRWATYWVFVAYMNKTSTARAAALRRALDPYAGLAQNFGLGFDWRVRKGVVLPRLRRQPLLAVKARRLQRLGRCQPSSPV